MNDDLDRELQTHLDLEAEEQREAGLPADQARYAALKTLGNQAHIREDVRALSPLAVFEDLLQDVRHGLRMLRVNRLEPHRQRKFQFNAASCFLGSL